MLLRDLATPGALSGHTSIPRPPRRAESASNIVVGAQGQVLSPQGQEGPGQRESHYQCQMRSWLLRRGVTILRL